jgi:hypothetical protein
MNAETWFQFGGFLFQSLSQRIPLSRCFLIGIQQKAWKELQLKFVNKTDKMTSHHLSPTLDLSFDSAWETSS